MQKIGLRLAFSAAQPCFIINSAYIKLNSEKNPGKRVLRCGGAYEGTG